MSFNRYLSTLDDQYDFIKKYAKPRDNICGVKIDDLTDLPYQVLKHTIPDMFDLQEFEKAIHLLLKHYKKNITFRTVKRAKNNEKLLFLLWIRQQYEKINKLEADYLTNPPDVKLIQAGIKELDILGDVNTIDSLSGGDILKWNSVRELPYNEIFNKLLKNTIEARINKRLVEINKQK